MSSLRLLTHLFFRYRWGEQTEHGGGKVSFGRVRIDARAPGKLPYAGEKARTGNRPRCPRQRLCFSTDEYYIRTGPRGWAIAQIRRCHRFVEHVSDGHTQVLDDGLQVPE